MRYLSVRIFKNELKIFFLLFSILASIFFVHGAHASATVFPKNVTINHAAETFKGFTLYTPSGGNTGPDKTNEVYLINMAGETVHKWKVKFKPGLHTLLLKNGHLLYEGRTDEIKMPGAGGSLQELDWKGKIVWEYRDKYLHHSFDVLPNGNVMVIAWEKMKPENKKRVTGGIIESEKRDTIWSDAIYELDRKTNKIVWRWSAQDQLRLENYPVGPLESRNEWTHANAIQFLPEGNSFNGKKAILVSFRQIDTVMVIDYESKRLLWQWGQGQIKNQHDPSLLENGNILLFDNGINRPITTPYSRVLEVNPKTNLIVWEYRGDGLLGSQFFSSLMGGAQRLPNGNTLITEAVTGRIFEVTKGDRNILDKNIPKFLQKPDFNNKIVWEYMSPHQSPSAEGPAIFKALRYSKDDIQWPVQMPDPDKTSLFDRLRSFFR